jgi:gas vesicle protein
MDSESIIIALIGIVGAIIGVLIALYTSTKSFRSETEALKGTVVDIRHETEMTLEESLNKVIEHIQKPSDLIPLVNEKLKEIEIELKNTKDDISPFLQLIKNENPKFTTAEGYFFFYLMNQIRFYLMNQIREDLDRVQGNIMADVDDKIATHFSRINLIFVI